MTLSGLVSDNWLSLRLGKPAWHLDVHANTEELQEEVGPKAFVDTRAPVSKPERIKELLTAGFNLVGTNVTLERSIGGPLKTVTGDIRMARANDVEPVAEIAGRSFGSDRFHADTNITAAVADRIKTDWARNFFNGARGDWMIVGEIGARITGFLLLLKRNTHIVIDLIAVDPSARRSGIASAMIAYATNVSQGIGPMRVGTELANAAALRLYESLGFRIHSAHHMLHLHV